MFSDLKTRSPQKKINWIDGFRSSQKIFTGKGQKTKNTVCYKDYF